MKYKRQNKADRNRIRKEEVSRKELTESQMRLLKKNETKERRRGVMRKMGMLPKDIEKLLDY